MSIVDDYAGRTKHDKTAKTSARPDNLLDRPRAIDRAPPVRDHSAD